MTLPVLTTNESPLPTSTDLVVVEEEEEELVVPKSQNGDVTITTHEAETGRQPRLLHMLVTGLKKMVQVVDNVLEETFEVVDIQN